jgi:hypothetical protein
MVEEVILNDIWTYHFHDPNNVDWTFGSYIRLADVSTVEDFCHIHECLKEKLKGGMFFLMREYIFPCWDDENNINGGCLSIKVAKENLVDFWEELCQRLLGETLLTSGDATSVVNGISTSPKRSFCIVKIWLRTNEYNDGKYYNLPDNKNGEVIYKENRQNIQKCHEQPPTNQHTQTNGKRWVN